MNGDCDHDDQVIVEVLLRENCLESKSTIEIECGRILCEMPVIQEDVAINSFESDSIESIILSRPISRGLGSHIIQTLNTHFIWHVYRTHSEGPGDLDIEDNKQEATCATHWCLPSTEFVGLWENLIFDSKIKRKLMKYVSSTLYFSQMKVDFKIIPWNKVVLLHGPPGTGKTSLCKALAQKICIQFSSTFGYGHLLEINCHNLFSKWFSESSKLVSAMFRRIEEIAGDEEALVIILIDEVESLAHSRQKSFSGNSEPSDSIRAVNALLTHLDSMKRYPNVLIFTTSNITEAIDLALVDRADIKQFIGLPSSDAIYQILFTCIRELQRAGIIENTYQLLSLAHLKVQNMEHTPDLKLSNYLQEISKNCEGISGRTVRKLPVLAYAMHFEEKVITLKSFLKALDATVKDKQQNEVDASKVNSVTKLLQSVTV